eukprot:g23463.t1
MKIEVVAEKFNDLEKGLFAKLLDRSVLYSYLFPRRFKTLITKESRLHVLHRPARTTHRASKVQSAD